jgi:hypothetical protein
MLRALGWILAFAVHAQEAGKEPTDRLVPPGWRGNPWGPEATRARQTGEIPPIAMTPSMVEWDRWGHQVLRDGDLVFRRGDAKVLFGYFPFSRFIANASGSRYSHVGIVSYEDGNPVIYDTTKAGVRRQPFHVWVLDNVGPIGVKRPKLAYRSHVPGVIAYLHRVFQEQVPFDYNLSLDDTELYCVEMAEKAYRSEGMKLSEPVKLGDMENATKFPICMFVFQYLSRFSLEKPLSFEQPVFFPGNERHGIWSSPLLETVYEVRATANSDAKPTKPKPAERPQANVARQRPSNSGRRS